MPDVTTSTEHRPDLLGEVTWEPVEPALTPMHHPLGILQNLRFAPGAFDEAPPTLRSGHLD